MPGMTRRLAAKPSPTKAMGSKANSSKARASKSSLSEADASKRHASKVDASKSNAEKPSTSAGAHLSLQGHREFVRNDSVTDFWRKLLALFVGPSCDSFSFRVGGCEAIDLARIQIFNDWQPGLKDSAVVRFQWEVAASEHTRDLRLRRFALGTDVLERLGRVPFEAWVASNEECPVDRLYFFSRERLLLEAEPNGRSLLFYEMTPARRDLLHGIEPVAVEALNSAGNWSATTLVCIDYKQ